MVKGKGLYSQTQQIVAHKVSDAIFRVFKLRKKGVKCGFPRFKSIDRIKSLLYLQFGFNLDKKTQSYSIRRNIYKKASRSRRKDKNAYTQKKILWQMVCNIFCQAGEENT